MKINREEFAVETINAKEKIVKFYVVQGQHDFLDGEGYPRANQEKNEVCAKAIPDKPTKHFGDSRGSDYRYYIRMDADQELFNPVKILSTVKNKKNNHFINSVCKNTNAFKEVTPTIFSKYIEYLKSKDIRWLKEAQRELV